MTKEEIAELEARVGRTIDEFNKDHEVTTSEVNGILLTLAIARTTKAVEDMVAKNVNLVQVKGQSPVPDNQG